MPIELTPSQFPEWSRRVLGDQRRRMHDAFLRAAHLSRTYLITQKIPSYKYPPVHTGRYKAGWFVEDLEDRILLGNGVPYAIPIEVGVRPHRMAPAGFDEKGRPKPYFALIRWAYLKIHRQGSQSERWSAAWATATVVARKHWERGRKGLKVMTNSIRIFERITEDELRREFA